MVGCSVVVGEPVVVAELTVVVGESPSELLAVDGAAVRLVVVVSGWPVDGWLVVGTAVLVSLELLSVVVLDCSRSNSVAFDGADVLLGSDVLPFTRVRFSTRP